MTWPYIEKMSILSIAVIVIIGIFLALALVKNKARTQEYPYQLSKYLLSKAERSFYGALTQALGSNGVVFSKVRVADVITPGTGLKRSDWQRAFNAVAAKHFDFVVCDPQDCSVRLAVELDDVSHNSRKVQKRDRLLNTACASAGLPLLRFKAAKGYVFADIRTQIDRALTPPDNALNHSQNESPAGPGVDKVLTETAIASVPPQCPKCGEPMLRRRATTGNKAGQEFWECSTFPKCRGIMKFI